MPILGYSKHPKDVEKNKGTVWEWFVGGDKHGWVRFAIQCKKSKLGTWKGDYEKLNHHVGSKRQIDILRQFARANNAVPFYSFYNHFDNATEERHWHCNKSYEQKLLGWTITPVENVELALSTKGGRNFKFIHEQAETLPVKCLFDCPLFVHQYLDEALVDKSVHILGTEAKKMRSMPFQFLWQNSEMSIDEFPGEFYDQDLGIYPKRIAVFNLYER